MSILGLRIFVAPLEMRRHAYAELTKHALRGAIGRKYETTPLDDVDTAWSALKTGSTAKLVVTGPGRRQAG